MSTLAPSTRITRLSRWALIGAAVLMGVALVATVWSTNQAVHAASDTLIRGQSDVFHDALRGHLMELGGAATSADLATLLDEHSAQGMRYVALVDADGHILAQAGPRHDAAALDAFIARARPGIPIESSGLVRVVFHKPFHHRGRWRGFRRGFARFLPQAIVLEFKPVVAAELREASWRTLGIGALAAGVLLLVALGLVRWFLRQEALERQLQKERRLASLGQMSAILAHEIRNPLASLKGNAQLLQRALPEGAAPHTKAELVVKEAIRLEALTNDLLEFARTGAILRTEVDPSELLREAAAAVDGDQINVDSAGAPASWPLDRERIRQVLVNLLENARQAGGEDGQVTASVAREGTRLAFAIRDHGPGISEDDLQHIFEPFYTRRTRGTGLGLAVARRLVELHDGAITASNAPGGGAIFQISIPRR